MTQRMVIVLLALSAVAATAPQTGDAIARQACPQRVYEISTETSYESDIQVLDYMLEDLSRDNAQQIYFVTFGPTTQLPGARFRLGERCRNYITQTHPNYGDRVHLIHSARFGVSRVEVWRGLAPPNEQPVSHPDIEEHMLPICFDQYDAAFSNELSWVAEEDPHARLSAFAATLNDNPQFVGRVVGFRGRSPIADQSSGLTLANREIAILVDKFGVERSRLHAINGGTKGLPTIALWLNSKTPANKRLNRSARSGN